MVEVYVLLNFGVIDGYEQSVLNAASAGALRFLTLQRLLAPSHHSPEGACINQ